MEDKVFYEELVHDPSGTLRKYGMRLEPREIRLLEKLLGRDQLLVRIDRDSLLRALSEGHFVADEWPITTPPEEYVTWFIGPWEFRPIPPREPPPRGGRGKGKGSAKER
jgi:hypothetical protein